MANNKKTNHTNPNRSCRSYLQIIYKDSAPSNFKELLKAEVDKGILDYIILSPWHKTDPVLQADVDKYTARMLAGTLNPVDMANVPILGSYKKEHLHLIAERHTPMQRAHANNYFQRLTNGSFVEFREDLRGAVRYLAHLDENPKEKALYDPDEISAYGSIVGKYKKFLEEEDKSMSSLTAFYELEDLIDKHDIRSYYDFEKMIREQDISLQLQFQKNARLANRVEHYINSRREEFSKSMKPSDKLLDMSLARRDSGVDKMLRNGSTVSFAEAQLKRAIEG